MNFTKNKSNMLFIILALAWPTVLEHLMQTAVQYIDVAMVGSLGTDATAAVGATTTVSWLVNGTVSALAIGFLAYISQALGAKESIKASRASAQAVSVTVICGIICTALTLGVSGILPQLMQVDDNIQALASQYFFILYSPMLFRCSSIILGTVLRSAGDTKTPMLIGVFVNLLNIILNFIFIYPTRNVTLCGYSVKIFGLGLGVTGAALASAIAFTLGGILTFIALWKNSVISPKGQSFLPNKEILTPCLKISFPNMLQRFGTSLGYVVFASMVNSLGEISTAAHTIANTVESAFYIPAYGMQTAAATLAGNAVGALDGKMLKKLKKTFLILECILMALSGAALFFSAEALVSIFTTDKTVLILGATVLKMVALSEPLFGIPIITEGFMQGMGKTVMPFVSNILCMWLVRILGTFIALNFFAGDLIAVWGCMIAHNVVLFIVFLFPIFKTIKIENS